MCGAAAEFVPGVHDLYGKFFVFGGILGGIGECLEISLIEVQGLEFEIATKKFVEKDVWIVERTMTTPDPRGFCTWPEVRGGTGGRKCCENAAFRLQHA